MWVYSHSYWLDIYCTSNGSRVLARERWQSFENFWKNTIFNEHPVPDPIFTAVLARFSFLIQSDWSGLPFLCFSGFSNLNFSPLSSSRTASWKHQASLPDNSTISLETPSGKEVTTHCLPRLVNTSVAPFWKSLAEVSKAPVLQDSPFGPIMLKPIKVRKYLVFWYKAPTILQNHYRNLTDSISITILFPHSFTTSFFLSLSWSIATPAACSCISMFSFFNTKYVYYYSQFIGSWHKHLNQFRTSFLHFWWSQSIFLGNLNKVR